MGRTFDDPVEDGGQADDRQAGADRVEGLGVGVLGVGDQEPAGHESGDHQRDVDEEHRSPPEVLEQEATGDRADGRPGAGQAGPEGDGLGPLVGREDRGQDRQRRRHDQGGADPHERPEGDELAGGCGEGRRGGAAAEDHKTDGQSPFAAEAVTQGPGGEEETGEHEAVGVDDPLEGAVAGLELTDQRGQRHVEHRVPHHDDDEAEAEDGQRPPSPAVVVALFHHAPSS